MGLPACSTRQENCSQTYNRHIMDFHNNIGMNHLCDIANDLLIFSGLKEELCFVLFEHFEFICLTTMHPPQES